MHHAEFGDGVKVRYRIHLEDGISVDSTSCDQVVEFVIGDGSVLPGLEIAVVGMAPGESKEEHLSHEWGFGPYRDDLTAEVTEQGFQALGITPYVGLELTIRHESGRLVTVVVTDVMNGRVRLDANHRLAGKPIRLSIELIGIARPASWGVHNGMNGLNGYGKRFETINWLGMT
jgi:peptidylprolyl isomerase